MRASFGTFGQLWQIYTQLILNFFLQRQWQTLTTHQVAEVRFTVEFPPFLKSWQDTLHRKEQDKEFNKSILKSGMKI